MGASDQRHVMWYDNTTVGSESDYEVDYRRWDGSSWAATVNFSQNQYGSKNPQVAASGSKVYLAWSDVQNGNYEIFFERSTDNGVTWTNPGATPTPTNTPTQTATNSPTATRNGTSTPAHTWTPSATPTSVSTGSGVTKYYYFGSLRVAMNVGGTVYYLHADHLGSTSVVVNDTGTPVAQQSYFAYGGIRAATGTSLTDYAFTGQRFDASDR